MHVGHQEALKNNATFSHLLNACCTAPSEYTPYEPAFGVVFGCVLSDVGCGAGSSLVMVREVFHVVFTSGVGWGSLDIVVLDGLSGVDTLDPERSEHPLRTRSVGALATIRNDENFIRRIMDNKTFERCSVIYSHREKYQV